MGKVLVIVSDLHCGSTVGLMGPTFENFEANRVEQNDFQKWLWECWVDLWDEWMPTVAKRYLFCVNGDLVDGVHHRTKEIVSQEPADHVELACQALELPMRGAERLFITEGTESHTHNMEHAIGARLDAVKNESGRRSFKSLHLEVNGCPGVIRHHITTTSRPYLEGSAMSIHMGVERLEASRVGHKVPLWFARAHRHKHGMFNDGNGLMVITGPWQGLTRYARKVVPGALPQPSCVVLDWRGKAEGELPMVHERVYKPKPPKYVIV